MVPQQQHEFNLLHSEGDATRESSSTSLELLGAAWRGRATKGVTRWLGVLISGKIYVSKEGRIAYNNFEYSFDVINFNILSDKYG